MVTLCPRITYCCCMSVRNGCLIYGYIKLVLAVAGFILDLTMDHEDEDISKIGAIILSVFAVIINIILIVGLHKYIKLLVKIYEIILWVLVALMVISMVSTAVLLQWVVAVGMLLLAVIFCVILSVLTCLFFIPLIKVYQILEYTDEDVVIYAAIVVNVLLIIMMIVIIVALYRKIVILLKFCVYFLLFSIILLFVNIITVIMTGHNLRVILMVFSIVTVYILACLTRSAYLDIEEAGQLNTNSSQSIQ